MGTVFSTIGYLLIGLVFMMLTLTIFYDIPQLNVGMLFMLRTDEKTADPEKVRLKTPGSLGPKYTPCHSSELISEKTETPSSGDCTPVHSQS